MTFSVVVPARFASTRLPGKPLQDIAGLPMVEHVRRRGLDAGAQHVIVATDDARIEAAVREHGGEAMMTSPDHASGTDRLAEVARRMKWADDVIVVNVQGDEPLIDPALIRLVAQALEGHPKAGIATLAVRIHTAAELFDPNVVKVVFDTEGYALYFSRAPIPWDRDAFGLSRGKISERAPHYRHIGLYAYRAGFLHRYTELPAAAIEQAESLEQLRALWNGVPIHVSVTEHPPGHGVDTPADLERVRGLMRRANHL
ncbi:MAG: 3-deoxy-manno-octulosonate cytidylyltransferase [Gammaproteobacteria bacterium]|nr:3-deoxy-manno-octulosonate cytidylyltransferase [Gammaproteobacteria bacterium]MCP5135204.1 3-deoxy-manno-octulosonate cytidylyltransferase [Gammaproteobacteria bacterium]